MPCCAAHARREVGVEHDQRGVVRAARRRCSTAWPISGERGLERRLDVRGRHVLAGRVDDELLLAVDDLAGSRPSSNSPMSPVCSQPSASIASAVLLGLVAVAAHHDVAADQHLAVLGELDLDARAPAGPTVPILIRSGGLRCRAPQVSRHAPQLGERQRRSRGRTRAPRRGVGAAPTLTAATCVEAEHRARSRAKTASSAWPRRARRAPRAPPRRPARGAPSRSRRRGAACAARRAARRAGRRASSPGRP